MSKCCRCGVEMSPDDRAVCGDSPILVSPTHERLQCRDRELANLHSHIRMQAAKLGRIREMIGDVEEGLL